MGLTLLYGPSLLLVTVAVIFPFQRRVIGTLARREAVFFFVVFFLGPAALSHRCESLFVTLFDQ